MRDALGELLPVVCPTPNTIKNASRAGPSFISASYLYLSRSVPCSSGHSGETNTTIHPCYSTSRSLGSVLIRTLPKSPTAVSPLSDIPQLVMPQLLGTASLSSPGSRPGAPVVHERKRL